MSGPLVGVTAWRQPLEIFLGTEPLQTLETTYIDAMVDAGLVPVVFPNGQEPGSAERMVAAVDGVILSGGGDIHPEVYGEPEQRVEGEDPDVDRFEIAVANAAREQGKPLLAICRGLQLLNVALGGTLNQDVTVGSSTHEPVGHDMDPEVLLDRRHPVHLEPDARLMGIYGSNEIKANTLHHQGIDRLADGLIVEGTAPDGLVEAARHGSDWWALGVQWHPERLDREHHGLLFGAFRDAIEAARGKPEPEG
jgi:putative glutamine amidotransferase